MRGISLDNDAIAATVEGVNEVVDRVVVLTRIDVHYRLTLPAGTDREKMDRALATHVDKCPTARSLRGAVTVDWTADIREA